VAVSYLLKEDGFHILLEDASGAILLEESAAPTPAQINVGGIVRQVAPQLPEREDDEAVAVALLLLIE
jgi:hypothetical protein